jgi:hypothetical protein
VCACVYVCVCVCAGSLARVCVVRNHALCVHCVCLLALLDVWAATCAALQRARAHDTHTGVMRGARMPATARGVPRRFERFKRGVRCVCSTLACTCHLNTLFYSSPVLCAHVCSHSD